MSSARESHYSLFELYYNTYKQVESDGSTLQECYIIQGAIVFYSNNW